MANKKMPQTQKLDWKADVARAKKMPDILPFVQLEIGQSVELEIQDEQPVEMTTKNKKTGEEKTFPALHVKNIETNQELLLGVSANSLRLNLAKIFDKNNGTLKGTKVRIRKVTYEHPEYGKETKGYRVEHLGSIDD